MTRWACNHPVYTGASVALMASTSYVGFLQSSLLDSPASRAVLGGQVDYDFLSAGSKTLYLGEGTGWRWQNGDSKIDKDNWEVGIIPSSDCPTCKELMSA